jgi:4-diphosphocytidyl-2C-methyl-D-erythritol kinase
VTLVVPARAKLNLDLAVLKRTDDGFHEISTHMQSIALHDTLELTPAGATSMTVEGAHGPGAQENSVLAAHAAIQEQAGRELPTRFHLDKHIPPGSGMGGASSDAAAAMRGLAVIYNLKLDLAKIASVLGADVPFFLSGGGARAEGRGERLTRLPTEPGWFAIAWPEIELSTAAVYRAWDDVKGDGANQRPGRRHVEPRLQGFAKKLGHDWQMTGSGSAFFAGARTRKQRGGDCEADCWTAVTHAVGHGHEAPNGRGLPNRRSAGGQGHRGAVETKPRGGGTTRFGRRRCASIPTSCVSSRADLKSALVVTGTNGKDHDGAAGQLASRGGLSGRLNRAGANLTRRDDSGSGERSPGGRLSGSASSRSTRRACQGHRRDPAEGGDRLSQGPARPLRRAGVDREEDRIRARKAARG